MYIKKKDRELVRLKYDGLCAYSGTPLEDDWQVDHYEPLIRDPWTGEPMHPERHSIENMVPAQKIINHYKGSIDAETFRRWLLGGLHERLQKLPKNPRTEKSVKKKAYLLKVAGYFNITPDTPFSGKFHCDLFSW
jgi:5-methylcytosine-specific restriction endonuclease McrA